MCRRGAPIPRDYTIPAPPRDLGRHRRGRRDDPKRPRALLGTVSKAIESCDEAIGGNARRYAFASGVALERPNVGQRKTAQIVRPSASLPFSAVRRCRVASSAFGRVSVAWQVSMCWDGSNSIDPATRRPSLSTNRPRQAPAGRGRRIFWAANTNMVTRQVRQPQESTAICGRYCTGLLSYRPCSPPCSLAEGFPEKYIPKPKERSVHVEIILRALKKTGVIFEDFTIISFAITSIRSAIR